MKATGRVWEGVLWAFMSEFFLEPFLLEFAEVVDEVVESGMSPRAAAVEASLICIVKKGPPRSGGGVMQA